MTSVNGETEMMAVGRVLGERFRGGEVLELVGDVGAGKTTLVKGIGQGLRVDDDVQSPSFTISRVYEARDGLELHHYDFYRLQDAGVMQYELAESISDPKAVTVVEWAERYPLKEYRHARVETLAENERRITYEDFGP